MHVIATTCAGLATAIKAAVDGDLIAAVKH